MTVRLPEPTPTRLLTEAVRAWAARHAGASLSRQALDAGPIPDPTRELAELGFTTAHLPEAFGGGGGVEDLVVVAGELAAELVTGSAFTSMVATLALRDHLHDPASATVCAEIASGSATVAVGLRGPVTMRPAAEGGLDLSGEVTLLTGPSDADILLVPLADNARWALLRRGQATTTELPAFDGARQASSAVVDVRIGPEQLLPAGLGASVDDALGLLCAAEAAGTLRRCVRIASEYAKTRHQFGRPIGAFQAVKHRCADLLVALQTVEALLWDAARRWPSRRNAVAAAAVLAPAAAVDGARSCLQVLGGIGFTWEHDIHLHLRRAMVNQLLVEPSTRAAALGRSCLANGLPVETPATAPDPTAATEPDLGIARWVLPVLRHVTPATDAAAAARDDLIAGILNGTGRWCQLFSEPGAGSDLAGLSTRATKVEGGWRLSGQKVWTSRAPEARWGFCLARTGGGERHRGISCFAVAMDSPGLVVRPLRQITGEAKFSEIFLDEVFVPDPLLIGEVDGGWALVRLSLAVERTTMSTMTFADGGFERVLDTARAVVQDEALHAPTVERLGRLAAGEQAVRALGRRAAVGPIGGGSVPDPTVRKLVTVTHRQATAEFGLDLLGRSALTGGAEARHWLHAALETRGLSIGGGTSEVMRNVIGERLLGLPRDGS